MNPNSYLRGQAAVAIWRIGAEADTALPVLLQEMPVTVEDSKWDWIIALGEMGSRAKAAVPQLRNDLLQDKRTWVLEYVTNALIRIDPEAASEAGVQARYCLVLSIEYTLGTKKGLNQLIVFM